MANVFEHDTIDAIDMQAIELEARRMRAEAAAGALRSLRIWVAARFATRGATGAKHAI